uniref:Neur_chan_LBD domain-containing protein n=1 Tax=Heterorhabditis bacteriophora TaxID=37862 RepID=A0A1I7XP77_HETBA
MLLILSMANILVSIAWDSGGQSTPTIQLTSVDYNDGYHESSAVVPGSSKKLTEYLLSRHNLNAPPDGLLDVHYEMELVHILGIDELKQTMTVLVYVDEKWTDPSLSWDPALFGGITKTWLPMDKIWVPDIIIFNMLEHEDLLSSVRAPALIYQNGTVEASHPAVHTVSCEINIKHFPLDDQRCALEIASWAYGKDKIRLHAHTEHSLEHYTDNEEWRLLKVSVVEAEYVHEGINVSELRYDVSVKRRPLFYMVTLTFPSYVMCAISVVGLFARFSTTGEREVVAYFLFNMVTVSIAAMTTGIVMRVHRMGRFGDEPNRWVMRIFCLRPLQKKEALCTVNPKSSIHSYMLKGTKTNGDFKNGETVPLNNRVSALEGYVRKLVNTCENIQGELDYFDIDDPTTIRRRRETNGYIRISERLDLLFMSFFLTLVTIPVAVLFYLS